MSATRPHDLMPGALLSAHQHAFQPGPVVEWVDEDVSNTPAHGLADTIHRVTKVLALCACGFAVVMDMRKVDPGGS